MLSAKQREEFGRLVEATDITDIPLMWDTLKERYNELTAQAARQWKEKEGNWVAFDSRRGLQVGQVLYPNVKTVSVQVGKIKWRVSPEFLRKATKEEIKEAKAAQGALDILERVM